MISDEGKGKEYVEEQAHGSADDRGAETTGSGTEGGTRGAGGGSVEARERSYVPLKRVIPHLQLLLILPLVLSIPSVAQQQQSYRSYQQLSGRVLRSIEKPKTETNSPKRNTPMPFQGWKHPRGTWGQTGRFRLTLAFTG